MQDVVIIPTYDRPEMLWLCLDYLSVAPESTKLQIRVHVDNHFGFSPPRVEIEEVLEKFPQLEIHLGYRHPHSFQGNSFNVLMAYREAYAATQFTHVFLVEDDVMIRPDFFKWHRAQHLLPIGCSIGIKNPGHGAYASLGVCFRREMLRMVLPHCTVAYFKNMRGYCRARFPQSKFDCEQDGLIARLLTGQRVVWASTPVAQHVGWYGYHRKRSHRPQGALHERYAQVKQALSDDAALREMVKDFGDIVPLDR